MPDEIRYTETDAMEIRSAKDGDNEESFVEGTGIVYDREIELFPGYFEKIRAGSFDKSIRNSKEIKSFINHNPSMVLATTRSKPALLLDDTKKALRFKAPIPPTSYGEDLKINLQRKNITGASFSFRISKKGDIVTRDEKGNIHREIIEGEIGEIGPVTNPAYIQTKVGLRDAKSAFAECEERLSKLSADEEIKKLSIAENILKLKRARIEAL